MKNKLNSIFLVLLLSTFSVFAQDEKIEWNETTYDFGTVNEKGEQVAHRFYFINKGKTAVKVLTAKASCGCTTPSWGNKPVFPGDTGFIEARYDPDNRPGIFNKEVTMYLENSTYSYTLYIKGFVQPPLTQAASIYKTKVGNLRFKNLNFNMGNVEKQKPLEKIFNVYNDGLDPITMQQPENLANHIKLVYEPQTIKPGEIGNIRLTYDAIKMKGYGQTEEELILKSDDKLNTDKKIKLNINILETFSDSMRVDPNRPILTLSSKDKYLGTIVEGTLKNFEFEFTNTGKSDLFIRDMFSSCDCMVYRSKDSKVKAGKTAVIKIEFNSAGKASYVLNTITIISNDPNNPIQTTEFRFKVTPKTE